MPRLCRTTLAVASLSALLLGPDALAVPPLAPVRVGEVSSATLDSVHPYPGGNSLQPVVWSGSLKHPGATYMKVRLSRVELGPGDEVVARDPAGSRVHRYQNGGPAGTPGFWTLSVPGDTILLEIHSRAGGGGWGIAVDRYEHGFEPVFPESICGTDDKRDARCYETSHPDAYGKSVSVGRYLCQGALCTGSLISCEDHFLTNQHCESACANDATAIEIWFDYQRPQCGAGNSNPVPYQGMAVLDDDGPLDYFLIRLAGNPTARFGYLQLDPRPLVADEQIYIPQHPGGRPKELGIASDQNAGNVCRIDATNRNGTGGTDTDAGYFCDTEGGSSGSPVLSSANDKVVALHHWGGCENQGIRMELIGPRLEPLLPGCSFCAPLPTPAGVTATANGPNRIDVAWTAVPGAAGYRIRRSSDSCVGTPTELATVAAPPYIDRDVSVGITYGYVVEALDASSCRSAASTCASATATGDCILPPAFAGLESARTVFGASCAIELGWRAAAGACSTDVVYNVYRSTTPGFTPGAANRVANCIGGTSYTDISVAGGVRYFYIVRAEDRGGRGAGGCGGGVEDANLSERPAQATAGSPLTDYFDGAETLPTMTLETLWSVNGPGRTGAAAFVVPPSGSGPIPHNECTSLVTPPVVVTATSVLSYAQRAEGLETEGPTAAWDGGTVELSSDGGVTWSQLTPTPGYTNRFDARSIACNADGLANGVYSGTDANWIAASVNLGALAGQEVRVRFRLGTDGSVTSTAWWVDDVRITATASASCSGVSFPREVSAPGSGTPMLLAKRPGGQIYAQFQSLSEALGYNYYQGSIGSSYDHGATAFQCNAATGSAGAGALSLTFTPGAGSHYYLATAWNGDPVNGHEGPAGSALGGIFAPPSESSCAPANNH